nr:hypothetical protein [Tanacetum cinerariifolium]
MLEVGGIANLALQGSLGGGVDFDIPEVDFDFPKAMAEKDAFLVNNVEGSLGVDYTDAIIVGRYNSGSDKNNDKELWDYLESKYMAEDFLSKKFLKYGKTGHFKTDFYSGKKNNANAGGSEKGSKDQSQDQCQNLVPVWNRFVKFSISLNSEAFYVQVDAIAWWIDSGATTHVCKDGYWFKTFQPVKDGSVLYMGDEHFDPVHGKGSIALEFSFGKTVTLFNVLYVPKLRKNLVSGPVLNKYGYKQVYESDKYILSKCGAFVGFVYYNNGVIHETISPYTPQQNGVAERKNRALKEMVNSMLSYSGLSGGFWGEAIAVVRLPYPKRKTLNEKGIYCIFVGYAEHSKAYRPKDIIPNSDKSQRGDHSDDVPNEISEHRKVGSQYSYCYSIEEDPRTYNEAMQSRDSTFRKEAIDDEIGFIMENNTWYLSDLPSGCKPLGCKWIFKRKMKVNGIVDKFKARLVIQGFRQKEGIDYFDTYAPVARITTIRLLLALAAIYNLVIHKMDVKTTFLNGKPVDQLEYSRAIGCLMYAMTSTRPDIAYTVSRLSRFTNNSSRQHWKAITRVLKYLRGTKDYGLSYVGYPSVLEGYSDASWINHVKNSSSTSGWVFLLGGGAISWASKKQTCITGSTMKSKFVALAAAGKEAEWLRNLIHEISI